MAPTTSILTDFHSAHRDLASGDRMGALGRVRWHRDCAPEGLVCTELFEEIWACEHERWPGNPALLNHRFGEFSFLQEFGFDTSDEMRKTALSRVLKVYSEIYLEKIVLGKPSLIKDLADFNPLLAKKVTSTYAKKQQNPLEDYLIQLYPYPSPLPEFIHLMETEEKTNTLERWLDLKLNNYRIPIASIRKILEAAENLEDFRPVFFVKIKENWNCSLESLILAKHHLSHESPPPSIDDPW